MVKSTIIINVLLYYIRVIVYKNYILYYIVLKVTELYTRHVDCGQAS